jgi:predicted esterase
LPDTHKEESMNGRGGQIIVLSSLIFCLMTAGACAQQPLTTGRSATLDSLLPADEARALAKTLAADREVHFRVRRPAAVERPGVFIFISPNDSGELPAAWADVLDQAKLSWIAADGFGNSRPTAERMLVAVMALKLARQEPLDAQRLYVSGLSGGGRVASHCITHFPHLFTGALFMAGADFYLPGEGRARELLATRRMVFLTGNRDFNRREMQRTYARYREASVPELLLMDEPGLGHERARPEQLRAALQFLDAR